MVVEVVGDDHSTTTLIAITSRCCGHCCLPGLESLQRAEHDRCRPCSTGCLPSSTVIYFDSTPSIGSYPSLQRSLSRVGSTPCGIASLDWPDMDQRYFYHDSVDRIAHRLCCLHARHAALNIHSPSRSAPGICSCFVTPLQQQFRRYPRSSQHTYGMDHTRNAKKPAKF